jgi:hypothetical protein
MTIENKCYYTELVSPVYFIKDANCYMQFPQQVSSGSIMKANFMTGIDQDTFGGALLYNVQNYWGTISVQFLVIWGYNSNGIYSHAWLIKYESTFAWDGEKLKRLHDAYDSQCDAYVRTRERLIGYRSGLKMKCETSRGGFEMKVMIPPGIGLLPTSSLRV